MQSAAAIDSARAVVAAHASYTTWALMGVIALLVVVIVALIRHHGGWDFITNLPTTNLRISVGIGLFAFFIVTTMWGGIGTKVWPPVDVILALAGAILLSMGLDVTQYGVKRSTEKPEVIAAYAAADATAAATAASCAPAPSPAPPITPGSPTAPVAPTSAAKAVAAHRFTPGD
jgi:hypothetical protein